MGEPLLWEKLEGEVERQREEKEGSWVGSFPRFPQGLMMFCPGFP